MIPWADFEVQAKHTNHFSIWFTFFAKNQISIFQSFDWGNVYLPPGSNQTFASKYGESNMGMLLKR